jgi:PAS domain S-box-containing protein
MLRAFFQSPSRKPQTPVSKALETILYTLTGSSVVLLAGVIAMPEFRVRWLSIIIALDALCLVLLILNRRGLTRPASFGLVLGLWAIITVLDLTGGGITAGATFIYAIVVFIAGTLLGARAGLMTALLCILTGLALVVIETNGYMPSRVIPYTPVGRWVNLTVFIAIMTGLQSLATRVINEAMSLTRHELGERKRAEDALRRSESRWHAVFDDAVIGIALVDTQGVVLEINPAMQRMLGYSEEELRRMAFRDFTHPDDRDRDLALFKELLEGKRDFYRKEKRYVRKDGRLVWANLSVSLISDEHGQGQFAVGMVEEITGHKRTEEALRESERRFSDMLTNLEMLAVMSDNKGNITFCNDYLLRLTGWKREEAIGQNWFEMFIPQTEQAKVSDILTDIPPEGTITPHFENEIKTRAGERRLVKWTNTTLRDFDGRVIGVAALGDDITERQSAEQENRNLLHKLQERVKELTALHEAARILQRPMTDIPQILHELTELLPPAFQYPETTAARLRLGQIETQTAAFVDSAEALRTDFTSADGLSGSIEVIYTKAHPPEMEGPFLTEERALINTLADMLRNSYDRQQAEEQLKTTTEQLRALMVRLRHAREEEGKRIAREIHDELGSALTSLRWELEDLNKLSDNPEKQLNPPALQEKSARMIEQIDATINDVRRIASELRPTILDDLGLVEAIEWQAQQFQQRTKIFCRCDCFLEDVELDQEQSTAVFRIFQEALTNILRHAQATRIDITTEKCGESLVLTIRDNGKGITESEKSGKQSLGILGMRERANLIGAKIEITGVEGTGTRLIVRVPIPAPHAEPAG